MDSAELPFDHLFEPSFRCRWQRNWGYVGLIQKTLGATDVFAEFDDVGTEPSAHAAHHDVKPELYALTNRYLAFQRIGDQFRHVFAVEHFRLPPLPTSHEYTQQGEAWLDT